MKYQIQDVFGETIKYGDSLFDTYAAAEQHIKTAEGFDQQDDIDSFTDRKQICIVQVPSLRYQVYSLHERRDGSGFDCVFRGDAETLIKAQPILNEAASWSMHGAEIIDTQAQ